MHRGIVLIIAAWLLSACPLAAPGEDAGRGDAGTLPPTCRDQLTLDQVVAIDPNGDDTQIQVDVAFDGERVWLSYNLPDADGGFDVYLTAFNCDGQQVSAPQRVNTTLSGNDVDPHIALGSDRIYLAWDSDNGTGVDNMDVFFRVLDGQAQAVMALDQILETQQVGQVVSGNNWNNQIVATASGFAIAGARGLPQVNTFQVYLQRLDAQGGLEGEAINARVEDAITQLHPNLAADSDDGLYLAAAASQFTPSPPRAAVQSASNSSGSYGVDKVGQVFLAAGAAGQITLRWGDRFGGDDGAVTVSSSGVDFAPRVVTAHDGGAVFWYRNVSGLRNELWAAPFAVESGALVVGDPVRVTPRHMPPYTPAATFIIDDIYFAAWSEGSSPAFRLQGLFVQLQ